MLRELEEAVQRKFHVPSDVSDTTGVAYEWESRLHISQVCYSIGSTLIWIIFNLIFQNLYIAKVIYSNTRNSFFYHISKHWKASLKCDT